MGWRVSKRAGERERRGENKKTRKMGKTWSEEGKQGGRMTARTRRKYQTKEKGEGK